MSTRSKKILDRTKEFICDKAQHHVKAIFIKKLKSALYNNKVVIRGDHVKTATLDEVSRKVIEEAIARVEAINIPARYRVYQRDPSILEHYKTSHSSHSNHTSHSVHKSHSNHKRRSVRRTIYPDYE